MGGGEGVVMMGYWVGSIGDGVGYGYGYGRVIHFSDRCNGMIRWRCRIMNYEFSNEEIYPTLEIRYLLVWLLLMDV